MTWEKKKSSSEGYTRAHALPQEQQHHRAWMNMACATPILDSDPLR